MADKKTPQDEPKRNPLNLKIAFDGKPEKEIQVIAYAFDRQGNLLSSAPVKDGNAQLALSPEQASKARLFFAPTGRAGAIDDKPTIKQLKRRRAYEVVWNFDPQRTVHELQPIPSLNWKYWVFCFCRARGQVVRPIEINGVTQELPVCNARVHICEVDAWPGVVWQFPDPVLRRLREEILLALDPPFRRPPLPDPPPFESRFEFDPRVVDPAPINSTRFNRLSASALNPQPLPPRSLSSHAAQPRLTDRASIVALNPQPEPPFQSLALLSPEIKAALSSPSLPVVRQALIDNVHLIRPYLCYWPWIWRYYTCDEITVVTTDEQGRFDTFFLYPCASDHPDLFFWVEYNIGGVWTTVYRPSLGCHTYWNYECGSEVTIRVNDPRVAPCNPPPDLTGLQVAIMSIGSSVSLSEIQMAAAGAPTLSNPQIGLTTDGRPFGWILEPHVYFSRSALIAAGITHYRWSFRRLTADDGTTPVGAEDDLSTWHILTRRVIRHYSHIRPDGTLSFPAEPMGPDFNNLFRIQPINPPAGGLEWSAQDDHEDQATAFFETQSLGNVASTAGKYELKLELFNPAVSVVNPVDLTVAGVTLKVANQPAPFGAGDISTGLASDDYLIKNANGHVLGFRLVVRVDNNPCEAKIHDLSGDGLLPDGDCGFIEYTAGAEAHLSFTPSHPHNFATFSFDVFRGNNRDIEEARVLGTADGAIHVVEVPVTTLLTSNKVPGTPDCDKAAFAQHLYVNATATDGWPGEINHLDASAVSAFALSPQTPHP